MVDWDFSERMNELFLPVYHKWVYESSWVVRVTWYMLTFYLFGTYLLGGGLFTLQIIR